MEKALFRELIEAYLLPLFSGSYIKEEVKSIKRDALVAFSNGYSAILVKPKQESNYRLKIARAQPFEQGDEQLVRYIISELVNVSSLNTSEHYKKPLQNQAIEQAICKFLLGSKANSLLGLIQSLNFWAERTYEGRRLSFGFIVCANEVSNDRDDKLHYNQMLINDFSALLSDGMDSWLSVDKDGFLLSHETNINSLKHNIYSPFRFAKIAESCIDDRIGLSLLSNGEILIFKDQGIKFAKRRGSWRSFSHQPIIRQLAAESRYTIEEIRKAIYESSLDVSFARTGGCIVYLRKSFEKEVIEKHVDPPDIIVKAENTKSASLKRIIGDRKFHELDRKLRQELLGIDGATIIGHDGSIITTRAIIKIEAGSTGGGRLAATKTLSKYGVAIKISSDGLMQGFKSDGKNKNPEPLFSLG